MPGYYSRDEIQLAELLGQLYQLKPMESMDLAKRMLSPDTIQHQTPVAPTPVNAAAPTPQHLEDANLSAWQQFSTLTDFTQPPTPMIPTVQRDQAAGQPSGRKASKVKF